MADLFAILGGLVLVVIMGTGVEWFLKRIESKLLEPFGGKPPVPTGWTEESWSNNVMLRMGKGGGGAEVGFLERFIFYASFLVPHGWPIAASWLAFKVASKWNSWAQLGEVPRLPENVLEDAQTALARVYRIGNGNRRFVIGTALNIVISLLAVALVKAVIGLAKGGIDV